LAIRIDSTILESACKDIIETILFALPDAMKGTVYRIGFPPASVARRVTSGIIDEDRSTISWGLPEDSDYNPPGKPWIYYRDEPGRPLEAMAWCVEKQRSWTAGDPQHDMRSVRLQVEGRENDFHHMEPVLIRKQDLYSTETPDIEYPKTFYGEPVWQNSPYVIIAVIKIHFKPHTIMMGGPQTKVIKKLSRALGTELLSYQLRQESMEAMQRLSNDRLVSCNILADALRNTIAKTGLVFSLIKLELGFLRGQWEQVLLKRAGKEGMRRDAIEALNEILVQMEEDAEKRERLISMHNRLLELSLPTEQGVRWVDRHILKYWDDLLSRHSGDERSREKVLQGVARLKQSLQVGADPAAIAAYTEMPDQLKMRWVDLMTKHLDSLDLDLLDRFIDVLGDKDLALPFQAKARKSLKHLKALAESMYQLEKQTNTVLREVLNGNGKCGGELTQCSNEDRGRFFRVSIDANL
jgi:hypothetical protein